MSSTFLDANIGYIVLIALFLTLNYITLKDVNILNINIFKGLYIGLYLIYLRG